MADPAFNANPGQPAFPSFDQRFPRGVFSGGEGPSIDQAFSGNTMNDVSRTEFALGRALREKAKQMQK